MSNTVRVTNAKLFVQVDGELKEIGTGELIMPKTVLDGPVEPVESVKMPATFTGTLTCEMTKQDHGRLMGHLMYWYRRN